MGSTGERLWDTQRGMLSGIHWQAALAGYWAGSTGQLLTGYSAGSTGELLWRDTRRDPLASRSGEILGGIHWRAALAGYSAGSTGEQLCQDTGRDPLASCPNGIHWYSAGSTGEPLWRDTQQDPLASRSGGILGGIHWRAALAGYSAGSTGELLWRDTGWGRGVEASQTRISTQKPTTPSCRVGKKGEKGRHRATECKSATETMDNHSALDAVP